MERYNQESVMACKWPKLVPKWFHRVGSSCTNIRPRYFDPVDVVVIGVGHFFRNVPSNVFLFRAAYCPQLDEQTSFHERCTK